MRRAYKIRVEAFGAAAGLIGNETFERVVVQNILHGLSPSLSDAISYVSRWRFIQSALPHIVQCCAALLIEHKNIVLNGEVADDVKKIGSSLSKVLYILHWMLIDSAAECYDSSTQIEQAAEELSLSQFLFPINTIQLFVYLLVPLLHFVKEEDIAESIRLENGLSMWRALWHNQQPTDLICFSAPVKPRLSQVLRLRSYLQATVDKANRAADQGIYIGADDDEDSLGLRSPTGAVFVAPFNYATDSGAGQETDNNKPSAVESPATVVEPTMVPQAEIANAETVPPYHLSLPIDTVFEVA